MRSFDDVRKTFFFLHEIISKIQTLSFFSLLSRVNWIVSEFGKMFDTFVMQRRGLEFLNYFSVQIMRQEVKKEPKTRYFDTFLLDAFEPHLSPITIQTDTGIKYYPSCVNKLANVFNG